MRIAVFQGPRPGLDKAAALRRLARAAARAADQGARLLVASEMFLSGYDIGAEAVAAAAEPADGPAAKRVAEIAATCRIAIAYGYPEARPEGGVYNAAQVIDRDGRTLVNYRKCHLFGDLDRGAFVPGEALAPLFTIDGVKIGILICYDVEFPESVRHLAIEGAALVIVPTALMMPFEAIPRVVVPARAFENQLFVAYANRCGTEGSLDYAGLSCIVGPDGKDLARAGRGEKLLVADLDLEAAEAARQANPYLADRRPELYRHLDR
ncbi:carbon-nitrogen hydrolase family protein [Zavarzinia sp.]|uniref:carbon-nitrogen hydrolase family protein n=1 Tax=Zavarzinia sp. TaxID=2027920 RepID=UPI003563133D